MMSDRPGSDECNMADVMVGGEMVCLLRPAYD